MLPAVAQSRPHSHVSDDLNFLNLSYSRFLRAVNSCLFFIPEEIFIKELPEIFHSKRVKRRPKK